MDEFCNDRSLMFLNGSNLNLGMQINLKLNYNEQLTIKRFLKELNGILT